jgi:hypothetical protein
MWPGEDDHDEDDSLIDDDLECARCGLPDDECQCSV